MTNIRHCSNDGLYRMVRVLSKQKHGISIVHINAQSLNNKMDELRNIFTSSSIDIVCVSETWFHPELNDFVYNLSDYNLFRADRVSNAGGVCIYIRKELKCSVKIKSETDSEIEYIFLELITKGSKILLGTLYRPNRNIPFNNLLRVIETHSVYYNDVIIAGDFNSNLLVEKKLMESMNTLGLYSVNTSTPTHFSSAGNTLLDAFFVNCTSKILLYDQLSASTFSKHDLIFITYDTFVDRAKSQTVYRDFSKIDFHSLWTLENEINWSVVYNLDSVEDQIDYMEYHITNLYNACVPLKSRIVCNNQQPWFSQEIRRLINYRDELYKRWKRFKTHLLYDQFKKARKKVSDSIKTAKNQYYQQKFSTAVDSGSKWKIIRNIGIGQKNKAPVEINLDELNSQFANLNTTDPVTNFSNQLTLRNCFVPQNSFSFRCADQTEVLHAFRSIKSNAEGMDGLNPKFLKLLLPRCLPFFTHIFNTILTKSYFPASWKYSKIIPLPKKNSDFRPIAILPFLSKVLEKLLCEQINHYIARHNLLTERQSGYRAQRSCITVLTDLVEELRCKMDENMTCILVLLDHSKAFDTVNHKILLEKLRKLFNFAKSACRLLSTYLYNRTQSVCHNNLTSNVITVNRGVPQGSILGPLLFSMYVNDLPSILRNCDVHIYADDVQLYASSQKNNIAQCIDDINNDLLNIYTWASSNHLTINPTKSKCILISNNKVNKESLPPIHINNSVIEFVLNATNLGVIFNERLNWTNHIQRNIAKTYGMLRNLWAVQNSTPLNIRMLLAKTYLVPVLLYGCELFANCNSADKRLLTVAYNSIARYIFQKSRRERISSYSYKIFNMSFDNLLQFRCITFLHKIIYTREPSYLYTKLQFARSNRGRKIIQLRYRKTKSEYQFLINTIRLWNNLPTTLQIVSNASRFKKDLSTYLQ